LSHALIQFVFSFTFDAMLFMITKCQAMLNLWQYGSNFNVKWVSLYPTIGWNGLHLASVDRTRLEKI